MTDMWLLIVLGICALATGYLFGIVLAAWNDRKHDGAVIERVRSKLRGDAKWMV